MEPKVSMTGYAVALIAGLAVLALAGEPAAAMWVGIGVAAFAASVHALYLTQRRGARRMPERFRQRRSQPVPPHRRRLDRWVLGQWLAIALLGAGSAGVIGGLGWEPFADVGLVLDVLSIGFVVLWGGIYFSALVDWFVILPKVSGISCPAPCERPGRQRWAGITALWCFHRGLARIVVPVVLIGCPAAIGAITKSGSGRAICFTIAAIVSVYLAEYELQGKTALGYSLNGRRYVGDSVWLVHETPYEVTRRAGYLVDVAAEGGKFKYLTDDGDYAGATFAYKHDDDGPPVALDKLNDRPRVEDAVAPCGEECAGVNWYCWRNPLAFSQTSDADDEDVDDPRAEELGSPRSRREN